MALNIGTARQPLPELSGETLFAWPEAGAELAQNAIIVRLSQGEAE